MHNWRFFPWANLAIRRGMETATLHRPAAAAPAWSAPRQHMVPIVLATILFYLLLLPEQLSPRMGGVFLPAYRLFMMPVVLYVLASVIQRRLRFAWPDLLIVLSTAWILLASYETSGSTTTAFIQFGAHFFDIAMAYFIARLAIQTPRDLRIFLVLIAPGVALLSFFVVQESITHVRLIQPLAAEITGVPNRLRDDVRLGLLRGAASFPHPILAGIFLASFLPLYLLSGIRRWPRLVGIMASIGGFFTMSSAALLGLLIGAILSGYDWLAERIENLNWRIFLFASSILYLSVESTSNSGFYGLLIRYASLNTASASNRILIVRFGTENIRRNPWFGIGYDDWDRPIWMHTDSFDHFWLILALRFGLPLLVMFALATIIGCVMVALKSRHVAPIDGRLLRGVAISLAVFALGGLSVSLWLAVLVWFSMLMGIAVSLGSMQQAGPAPSVRPPGAEIEFGPRTRGIAGAKN